MKIIWTNLPTGHTTDTLATFPINGNMKISLFLGSPLAEFIDGVKFIKRNIDDDTMGWRFTHKISMGLH